MKKWMQKLVNQIEFKWEKDRSGSEGAEGASAEAGATADLNEERATLLFMIDTLNKHLLEMDSHPTRGVREVLDSFSKEVIQADEDTIEKVLFKFRQFYGTYRIAEFSYVQTTFDEFRRIILEFVDQLGEDLSDEKKEDQEIKSRLEQLREAVESNSIDTLKSQSRSFIDTYIQTQSKKEKRRSKRAESIKKNLDSVKKQLFEVQNDVKYDHLTGAYTRRSFDSHIKEVTKKYDVTGRPMTLISFDIDHFKKVNDTYGHDCGDFVLQECVKMVQAVFSRPDDFMARVGGEEFLILCPDYKVEHALKQVEIALQRIRSETFLKDDKKINFTISVGIAQHIAGEKIESWLKRADKALYQSKNNGRDRCTVAPNMALHEEVA